MALSSVWGGVESSFHSCLFTIPANIARHKEHLSQGVSPEPLDNSRNRDHQSCNCPIRTLAVYRHDVQTFKGSV
jgi:hypothetical protein